VSGASIYGSTITFAGPGLASSWYVLALTSLVSVYEPPGGALLAQLTAGQRYTQAAAPPAAGFTAFVTGGGTYIVCVADVPYTATVTPTATSTGIATDTPTTTNTPPAGPTATATALGAPTASPTAIGAVGLSFAGIYTTGQQLLIAMANTGDADNDMHMLIWAWGGLIIGFFVLSFIASLIYRRWRDRR
jgi:hypothetical protein